MKVSQLADETNLSIATIKFYLRKGLLHPGRALSRTQAEYDQTHVDRLHLIRALTDTGGLSVATAARVISKINDPDIQRLSLLRAASQALLEDLEPEAPTPESRAARLVDNEAWQLEPNHPCIALLDKQLKACDEAGVSITNEDLKAYAEAAIQIAQVDIHAIPQDAADAAQQVIVGTLLSDSVMTTLRRMAQNHVSVKEVR